MTYDKTSKKKILKYARETSRAAAIERFKISSQTLYAWIKAETPDYVKPKRKQFFRKLGPKQLKIYVLENPNQTCAQIGQHFGVSDVAVLKSLRKLGFSFKKRNYSILNEMKQSERSTERKSSQ
ncbi:MAG: transposase [Streptococcaceae bacterium]|jgi:transposase|nr:transposase [Streptococcaceae bacterium]